MAPKEEINLRSIPSVTDETVVVIATVPNGEVLHWTGINNEYGWSRIDDNGTDCLLHFELFDRRTIEVRSD